MDDSTHARLIELATEPDGRGRHTSTLIVEALDLMVPRHQKKDVFHDLNPIRIRVKALASDAPREAVMLLMEAALPGWRKTIYETEQEHHVILSHSNGCSFEEAFHVDMARAILIAVLRAKQAKEAVT